MKTTASTNDPTLDPALNSWLASANDSATDFPIQNLPYCVFVHPEDGAGTLATRVGDSIVDLAMLHEAGVLGDSDHHDHEVCEAVDAPLANYLVALPAAARRTIRVQLQKWLLDAPPGGQQGRRLREKALHDVGTVELVPPVMVHNYTDFYASIHHAATVGSMFRPDNALLPNYKHVPIGYHGRASSIVPSGSPVRRPIGQLPPPDDKPGEGPTFGPCKLLDYELELGVVVGGGNELGDPISIAEAREHMAGLLLVNDWSARDIQKWEYQPLGPFLAKNFATTVSNYLVTTDALAPFRCTAPKRPAGDPTPLAYLLDSDDQAHGGFDITLEVFLASEQMRKKNLPPLLVSRGSFQDMYWTFAQMIAHHTSNGCNLYPGDLLASGTISGASPDSRGCLLERTWQGRGPDAKPLPRKPLELPTGETRTFLSDGDEVIFKAFCEKPGLRRIGFGECRGVILPARAL
jgi:fumarylacetoacetase